MASSALAEEGGGIGGWFSGDWYLKVGARRLHRAEIRRRRQLRVDVFADHLARQGRRRGALHLAQRQYIARPDRYRRRSAPASSARFVLSRDDGDSADLAGLDPVRFGVEVGGFAEFYPTDWLRVRGEVRRGVRAHEGVVGDVEVDAFADITPEVRISGGPRMSIASADYFDAYYGVSAAEFGSVGPQPLHARQRREVGRRRRRDRLEDDRQADDQRLCRVFAADRAGRRFRAWSRSAAHPTSICSASRRPTSSTSSSSVSFWSDCPGARRCGARCGFAGCGHKTFSLAGASAKSPVMTISASFAIAIRITGPASRAA